jgi:hypothetical protein
VRSAGCDDRQSGGNGKTKGKRQKAKGVEPEIFAFCLLSFVFIVIEPAPVARVRL